MNRSRRPKSLVATLAAIIALLTVMVMPASAITNGQPDGGAHPQVGQLLFYVPDYPFSRYGPEDPGGWFNCSGTLISGTLVLTAGHCTYAVGLEGVETTSTGGSGGNDVWVNFSEFPDYSMLQPSGSFSSNAERYASWSAALDASSAWIRGSAYPHESYIDAAFYLYDLGMVELTVSVPLAEYARIAPLGHLDTLAHPKGQSRFTAVGYGLEYIRPVGLLGGDSRRTAEVMLVDSTGVFGLGSGIAAIFSNNNGKAHQGGTCYGDSGGPVFAKGTLTIVAVNSFGVTPYCTGNGGGYRVDQPDDHTWLWNAFGVGP
jgi:hypothetical protein